MERHDTISGALAIIGYLMMVAGLLAGWYFAQIGGGLVYFIIVTLLGVAIGMLFVGMAFILNKLDNLAELIHEQKASTQDAPVLEPEKE